MHSVCKRLLWTARIYNNSAVHEGTHCMKGVMLGRSRVLQGRFISLDLRTYHRELFKIRDFVF